MLKQSWHVLYSITAEQLQTHSANECEAGTQGTPTAIHTEGLMNLSKGNEAEHHGFSSTGTFPHV